MQASVWRNAWKQKDVNANWGFHGSGIYSAVIWIMLTSCLVTVTEQEQLAASTLYTKHGGSMFFETSVTTYQNTSSQTPGKKKTYKRCKFDSTGLWRRYTTWWNKLLHLHFIFLTFNSVQCFGTRQWFRLQTPEPNGLRTMKFSTFSLRQLGHFQHILLDNCIRKTHCHLCRKDCR